MRETGGVDVFAYGRSVNCVVTVSLLFSRLAAASHPYARRAAYGSLERGALHGKTTLQGSKAGRAAAGSALRAIARRLLARGGAVTYSVVEETVERRREGRRPARLQSGKILVSDERFLTEFSFRDRSEKGVRLRLAQRVVLPRSILLFDDWSGGLFTAAVVWQHGCDVGCRVSRDRPSASEKLLARLRNPYYAVR